MITREQSEIEAVLGAAASHALEFLRRLDERPANATVDAITLRQRLDRALSEHGMAPQEVIASLIHSVEGGLLGTPSGRFFAWVIGGALPSALAADWLTSAWGQNAALYVSSPAAAEVENVAGGWLKEILGLPNGASFAFVTGCQTAHLTCLAVARDSLLRNCGWDVKTRGLAGAPQIRVICSARVHASIEKAVRLLGLGTNGIVLLPPNNHEVLEEAQLGIALDEDAAAPTIVVLQAGDINTGAFEPFESLIPVAKQRGAWVHIDGAFGLWAAASSAYRRLTAGAVEADSWATDGHKWLNVPFDCGYAFVRSPDAHRSTMSVTAPYIAANSGVRDAIDWNPKWSRRARGFATYAALMELGRRGVSDLIERTCRYAEDLVNGLGRLPNVEVLWRPIINQGLVRFLDPRASAAETDHDRRTEEIVQAIVETGEAFFAATTWRDKRAMRVSVLNWRTCERDVERAVAAAAHVLRSAGATS
jgi:glutamate/tyrosine decarboxylase-like PLP-dependent enzyme